VFVTAHAAGAHERDTRRRSRPLPNKNTHKAQAIQNRRSNTNRHTADGDETADTTLTGRPADPAGGPRPHTVRRLLFVCHLSFFRAPQHTATTHSHAARDAPHCAPSFQDTSLPSTAPSACRYRLPAVLRSLHRWPAARSTRRPAHTAQVPFCCPSSFLWPLSRQVPSLVRQPTNRPNRQRPPRLCYFCVLLQLLRRKRCRRGS
jgi:hypothetical protein